MRGSIRQRGKKSWLITLEFGYVRDAQTGAVARARKFFTFHGTKKEAQDKLRDELTAARKGEFVEPDKRTVGQWLDEWVDLAIKPPRRTQRAYDTYRSVIALHLKPGLGHLRLQGLRSIDIESFLADKASLAPATLEKIFTVLSSALKAATKAQLVVRNVATLVSNRPNRPEGHPEAVENCWTAEDAVAFLRAAKQAGPRPAAFYALALDSGVASRSSQGYCGRTWI